jgi:hypothetical protein
VPWRTSVGAAIRDSGGRCRSSSGIESWFCAAERVAGALDVPTHEVSNRRLVERALAAREHARVVDQVIDHRVGI